MKVLKRIKKFFYNHFVVVRARGLIVPQVRNLASMFVSKWTMASVSWASLAKKALGILEAFYRSLVIGITCWQHYSQTMQPAKQKIQYRIRFSIRHLNSNVQRSQKWMVSLNGMQNKQLRYLLHICKSAHLASQL